MYLISSGKFLHGDYGSNLAVFIPETHLEVFIDFNDRYLTPIDELLGF